MEVFILVLSVIALALVLYAIGATKNTTKKINKIVNNYEKQLREAREERDEYKELRLEEVHKNTLITTENKRQTNLLQQVADLSVTCPLDSEKLVLAKIKELTRDYQSKN